MRSLCMLYIGTTNENYSVECSIVFIIWNENDLLLLINGAAVTDILCRYVHSDSYVFLVILFVFSQPVYSMSLSYQVVAYCASLKAGKG